MTPAELAVTVRSAIVEAVEAGDLSVSPPADVTVERPKVKAHGDYATNIALRLAKAEGRPPREIAELLATRLRAVAGIDAVDVAGPGFLNVRLSQGSFGQVVHQVLDRGSAYGTNATAAGQNINLEFVSANPTGPIHIGGARWAAVGDALARLLEASGAEVTREYYFNDHGAQIDRFARSLLAAAKGDEAPEDGYGGAYIADIARSVLAKIPDALEQANPEEVFRAEGVDQMFGEIRAALHEFGVDFDVYFHENSLHDSGAVGRAVERLRANGHIFEQDGAVWLRTTAFGDDKDRVVLKSDGEPAYISGDLAYYLDKRERGFDRVVIMLGADHHGYVGRLMAMCAAFGDTPGVNLEILIGQMVNLLREGEPLRMSKRAGTVLTLEDLVEAVGVDAARYALARSNSDSTIDIDLALWSKQTSANPVYYVQYAATRAASILRTARELDITEAQLAAADLGLLTHPLEAELLRRWPNCRPLSPRPPSCASPIASPATSRRRWPSRRSGGSTRSRSAGRCRIAVKTPPPHRSPGCSSGRRPAPCSRTVSACSASAYPNGCDGQPDP